MTAGARAPVDRDEAQRWRTRVLATLEHAGQELDAMQVVPAGDFALAQETLADLIAFGRRPRVAAVGRRGSAKSSLLNALAHAPVAAIGDVQDATRVVHWRAIGWGVSEVLYADTPGLRASGRTHRVDETVRALTTTPPDVLLVLCHATEVDAGIDDDLGDVHALVRAMERTTGREVPIIAVPTRVDELDPPDVLAPPFDDVEKQRNIVRAGNVLRAHLVRHGIEPVAVVPIATYMRFEQGVVRDDLRWNVDRLVHDVTVWLPDPLEREEAAGREIPRLLAIVMDSLVEVLAARVMRHSDAHEEARARELLVRWLRGLSPFPARAGAALDVSLRRAAPLGWARGAFAAIGATRWSAVTAAVRLRAMGSGLRDRLLAGVAPEVFAALATTASDAPEASRRSAEPNPS